MRFDGFVLAVDHHPEPQRGRARRRTARGAADSDYGVRGGLAFAVLTAPRVNAPAWFALAVAAPSALLALAAALTMAGLAQAAGACAALLLIPAILLALRALEVRRFRPAVADDPGLTRAFCLTVGQACGLLFVVILGAPLSGQAVGVGLAMAATPLAVAVVGHAWRRLFRPVEAQAVAPASRDWLAEWAETERLRAPPKPEARPAPEPVAAPVVLFPTPQRAEPAAAEADWAPAPRKRAGARR